MKCYRFDDCDLVIAENIDDAHTVWCEHLGEQLEDYDQELWEEVPSDTRLKIIQDDPDPAKPKFIEKTIAEWITETGRGFLASSEF